MIGKLQNSHDRHRKSLRGRPLSLESLENRQLLALLASLRLEATDLAGTPVTTLLQGQDYHLNALVRDLRASDPQGVYSAYFDLTVNDNNLLSVVDQQNALNGVLFSPWYLDGRTATNSVEVSAKEVGEAGAFTQTKYFGEEKQLFQIRFTADAAGTLIFGANPAEDIGKVFALRLHGTLANEEVSFGSLSLNVVNNVALTNDFFTVNEDAAASTRNVLNNDPGGSATWTIQSISDISAGGTVTIASDGKSISYKPAADFSGTETFKYQAIDGSGVPGEATVTVTINSVNDAPRNQFPPANKRITDEDTPLTFSQATGNHIGIWDDGVSPATNRVNLFAVDGGAIFLPNLADLISQGKIAFEGGGNGTASMQFRGNTADVNAALAGLQFTPKQDFFTVSPSQLARIRLWTREVDGPTPLLQADNTFEVTVNSVNDAPVNVVPGAQTADSATRVITFDASKRVSTNDVDVGSNNLRVTLSVNSGVLQLGSTSGITFSGGANNSASMTINGSATNVNNALLNLKYTGNVGTTSDVLTVLTSDLGSSGSGGTKTDQDTVNITIAAQNQAPVNTVPGPQTFTASNRVITFDSTKRISVSDADAGNANLRITVWVNNGIINLGSTNGLTFKNGTTDGSRYILFDGNQTDVNAALLNLAYTANAGATSDVFTIDTNDLGNTGAGGSKVDRDTISLTQLGGVNQAPVNTVPGAQTFTATNRSITFGSSKRISTNDPDVGSNNLRVTLFVNGGVLKLGTTTGLTFRNGADNTRYMLFDGTQASINNALLNLKYTANSGITSDVLTFDVNDLGNTGTGGSKVDRDTIALSQVGGANQAPVNSVPGPQTYTSSNPVVTFNSSRRISTNDPDVGSGNLRMTVFVNNGVIKLGSTNGLTFLNGSADNTRYLLFDGTQANVNNALLNLRYTANSGATSDVLTVDTYDLGNTGTGGAKSDRDTITLTRVAGSPTGRSGGNGSGEAGSRNSTASTQRSSATDQVFSQSTPAQANVSSADSATRLIDLLASANAGRAKTASSADSIFENT